MKKEVIYDKLLNNLNDSCDKFYPDYLTKRNSKRAKYYYKKIEDNCYYKPHNKLADNARCIYSSAMMIYNLLGNKVNLNNELYDVIYEEELEAIKKGKGRFESHRAHLDATLRSSKKIIFCEAKFSEWFSSPKMLASAYLDSDKYLDITKDKEVFIKFFNTLIKKDTIYNNRYKSIYKRYDAIQMTIHILGIYNYVKQNKNKDIKDICLINCVWGYEQIPEYNIEKQEAKDYLKKANEIFTPLFKTLGVNFQIEYLSFHELKSLIDFSCENDKEEYLKRYDIIF